MNLLQPSTEKGTRSRQWDARQEVMARIPDSEFRAKEIPGQYQMVAGALRSMARRGWLSIKKEEGPHGKNQNVYRKTKKFGRRA